MRLRLRCRRGNYWCATLREWLEEVKDILESEYNVRIVVEVEEADIEEPVILDEGGREVLRGVPGEPGYLIEQLKLYLDERLGR